MSGRRPNFLLVMAEHMSALSDPNTVDGFTVRMPALQRFADTSVRFHNAYCNSPVCGPARMSFLSGRYVCNHGAYDNGSALPPHVPTFAHLLTANGYHTVMCGRMHYHGLDPLKGFERRLVSEIHNPLLANSADMPGPFEPIRPLAPAGTRTPASRWSDSPIFDHDAHVTRTACEFLRTHAAADDERPFCMTVGYLVAHPSAAPMPALKPLYEEYIRQDLPIAPFTPADYDRLPEHIKRLHQLQGHDQSIFSTDVQRHQMAAYLARLTYLDVQLGQVLGALAQSGLADDTVVVFLSDHGDGMGRHGLWGKMFFYEEAEHIPYYIHAPGMRMRRTVTERVSCSREPIRRGGLPPETPGLALQAERQFGKHLTCRFRSTTSVRRLWRSRVCLAVRWPVLSSNQASSCPSAYRSLESTPVSGTGQAVQSVFDVRYSQEIPGPVR